MRAAHEKVHPERPWSCTDTDGRDFLNGGDGADTLEIGAGDVATGGEGADLFLLGDWIDGTEAATLMDFDPAEDQLMVLYQDIPGQPDPELSIRASAVSPGVVEILLDGEVLAELPEADAPTLDSIVLIAESSASLAEAS